MESKIKMYNDVAYEMLSSDYHIRDKFLKEWSFYNVNYLPCLKLSFSAHIEEDVLFELELKNLVQFDFYFHEHYSTYVEDYKLNHIKNGEYYLSLDPYNAVNEISGEDKDVIIARELILIPKK